MKAIIRIKPICAMLFIWGMASAHAALIQPGGDDLNDNSVDPVNSASAFAITQPSPSPSGFVFNWNAIEGRTYSVVWTDSLTNSFGMLTNGIPPPPSTDTVYVAEDGGFCTLNVQLGN